MARVGDLKQRSPIVLWLRENAIYFIGCGIAAWCVFFPEGIRERCKAIAGRRSYLISSIQSNNPTNAYMYVRTHLPLSLKAKSPNAYSDFDDTGNEWPLAEAARSRPDLTHLLLRRGVNPKEKNPFGMTALHFAQTYETTSALLEAGADPNQIGGYESTPLDRVPIEAADRIQLLLDHGACLSAGYIDGQQYEYLCMLADGIDMKDESSTGGQYERFVAYTTTHSGHNKLLSRKESIQKLFDTAVSRYGRVGSNGVPLGIMPPPLGADYESRTILALLKYEPDVNGVDSKTGMTPLLTLSRYSKPRSSHESFDDRLVQQMIQHGAQVNAVNPNDGNTALHYAVQNHCCPLVETLLKSGADLTIKNKKGQTARSLLVAMEEDLR